MAHFKFPAELADSPTNSKHWLEYATGKKKGKRFAQKREGAKSLLLNSPNQFIYKGIQSSGATVSQEDYDRRVALLNGQEVKVVKAEATKTPEVKSVEDDNEVETLETTQGGFHDTNVKAVEVTDPMSRKILQRKSKMELQDMLDDKGIEYSDRDSKNKLISKLKG